MSSREYLTKAESASSPEAQQVWAEMARTAALVEMAEAANMSMRAQLDDLSEKYSALIAVASEVNLACQRALLQGSSVVGISEIQRALGGAL